MRSCRGWGLRAMDDIPAGTFLTTYSGQLLTEADANEVRAACGTARKLAGSSCRVLLVYGLEAVAAGKAENIDRSDPDTC